MPTSNGFTILRNRDGGVGVFTIGNEWNVPFRDLRIEFGVWNSFVMVKLVELVTTFVVKLLIPVLNDWFAESIASLFPGAGIEFIFHWYSIKFPSLCFCFLFHRTTKMKKRNNRPENRVEMKITKIKLR